MLEAMINEKQLTFLRIILICVYIRLLGQTPSAAWSSWIHHKCLVQRIVFVIVRSEIQTVYQSKEIMRPYSRSLQSTTGVRKFPVLSTVLQWQESTRDNGPWLLLLGIALYSFNKIGHCPLLTLDPLLSHCLL